MEPLEPRLLLSGSVLISELMADNESTFTDGYGDQPDWIELQNTTSSPIDLTEWQLIDSGNEWTFPAVTLPAQGYLLLCATDETGQDPAGYWHIGFKLTSDGEYLALLDDMDTVVHAYTPNFPRQLEDISYGVLYEEYGGEVLVEKGDAASYLVPTGGPLDPAWTQPAFDDSGWAGGTTGLGFGLPPSGGTVTLIDTESVWSYLDDGSDQGAAWRAPTFDDSVWASGPAQLGYGDGDEATVVSYGPDPNNKYITTYFRHSFNVDNAWSITDLTIRVLRDDGAVMYLNGHELPRSNMPSGPIDYLTTTGNTSSETQFFEHHADPAGMLVEGENVLAVEIHQTTRRSTDISFDLELIGETSMADLIETDLEAAMLGLNASALVRVPFTVADPSDFSHLVLEMAYEDGYVAYLNGTPVASRNAPGTPEWNSAALSDRSIEDAVQFQGVDLTPYLDLLVSGDKTAPPPRPPPARSTPRPSPSARRACCARRRSSPGGSPPTSTRRRISSPSTWPRRPGRPATRPPGAGNPTPTTRWTRASRWAPRTTTASFRASPRSPPSLSSCPWWTSSAAAGSTPTLRAPPWRRPSRPS